MNQEIRDDPRQVLAILNSLGIVNITAQELKEFLKALKLYRKVIQNDFQECKQKKISNILQNDKYIKNHLIVHKLSELNPIIIDADKQMQTSSSKVVINKIHCILKSDKANEIEENLKSFNKSSLSNQVYRNNHESKKSQKNLENIKIIIHPIPKIKNMSSHSLIRARLTTETTSDSQSFIKSKNEKSKISLFNKKVANDPVTLYNHYKSLWEQLSIPGEETHLKLRWAVREKILGFNFVTKPSVQINHLSKTSSIVGNKK